MSFLHRSRTAFALSFMIALGYAGCSAGGNDDSGGGGSGKGGGGSGGKGGTNSGGSGALAIGGGSGDGGSGGSAGDACASKEVTGTLLPANLYIVVDRSGSMNCNLPSDGQTTAECEAFPQKEFPALPSKWELTRDALKTAIDDLQTSGNVSAGMVAFPTPASDCGVNKTPDVPIAALDSGGTQAGALKAFLDGIVPKGSTPVAGATILAYAHLYDELVKGTLPGNSFVVLLTDGFETCNTAALTNFLAEPSGDIWNATNELKVRTFVIGVPGSEDGRALLSQIAWIGGTPKVSGCTHTPTPNDVGDCHFDMTTSANFSTDLKAALAAISGTVLSCELDMPTPDPGKKINFATVKVSNSGTEVAKDESKPCDQGANGWQFNADKTKIFLCGTACDDAKKPGVSLKIDLGCQLDIR